MKQVNLGFYRMVLFLLLGLFTSVIAYSQQISVKGIVKDQIGEPVIGANVLVRGTTNGVITNVNGEFILSASKSDVLVVSFVGYTTQEIPVSEKQMTIVLKEDTELLDEVVVLGYGANTRKQDLSASVGIISNTDELAARPVTSTESMLQGQLPGVTIQADGGDPTSTPNIVIRGQGSQNGDNVLWVVDGVPGAPITSMNDIESIVVLKDAASAAIYGAQSGAGGVVLVTTKKAKEGAPTLTYDGTFGFRQATNLIEPLNAEEQVEMRRRSYENAGQALPDGWNVTKNPWVGTTRTDWMDAIFRTAFYQRHNIALNVGTDKSSSRLSLSFDNDQGTLINTYKKNLALRYNGKMQLNKWITISEDLVWKNTTSRSKETDNDAYTGPILSAVYMPASATIYNPLDGSYGGTTTEDPAYIEKYGSNFADAHGDAVNPVRLLEAENLYNKTSDVWSTTSLEIGNVLPGLKFVSRFTYNLQNYYYKKFNPIRDEVGKPNLSNNVQEQSYRMDAWKTENTLTYDNTFGKHTVGALFSTTADHYSKRGLEAIGKDLSSEAAYLQYMAYANSTEVLDYLTGPDANVSMIARLAYSYDDRYFVTASWRRDYAGRLPKEHNFGDFPAVTLGWKISNEKFFKKNDIVNLDLFFAQMSDPDGTGHITTVAVHDSTEIHSHEIAVFDHFIARFSVGLSRVDAGHTDRREGQSFRAITKQRFLDFIRHHFFRHPRFDKLQDMGEAHISHGRSLEDLHQLIRCFHHVRHYLSPPIIWSIPRSETSARILYTSAIIMEKRIWHCRYCAAAGSCMRMPESC